MENRNQWVKSKVRTGWILLAIGLVVIVAGIIAERQFTSSPYNLRILTGVGIVFAGLGIANLVRYAVLLRDGQSARRIKADEQDERNTLIRLRAGNRAYLVSAALIYAGLMWASFASNGDLPDLSGDVLWFFLAACVVLPFGMYAVSMIQDQKRM